MREPVALLLMTVLAVIASAWSPHSPFIWWLEAAPVLIGLPVLLATRRRFPLTALTLRLLFLHGLVLLHGAHYTYAQVPLGEWARDVFEMSRNPYDRLGHVMQGFVPAILARELLLRTSALRPGRWLFFLVLSIAAMVTVSYELLEWWAAVLSDSAKEDFLSLQGDDWDTQWDMALALGAAAAAQLLLGRAHDRALAARGFVGPAPAGWPGPGHMP